jgi:hypothetical protein
VTGDVGTGSIHETKETIMNNPLDIDGVSVRVRFS